MVVVRLVDLHRYSLPVYRARVNAVDKMGNLFGKIGNTDCSEWLTNSEREAVLGNAPPRAHFTQLFAHVALLVSRTFPFHAAQRILLTDLPRGERPGGCYSKERRCHYYTRDGGVLELSIDTWRLRDQCDADLAIGHEYWFTDGVHIGYHGRSRSDATHTSGKHIYGRIRRDGTECLER